MTTTDRDLEEATLTTDDGTPLHVRCWPSVESRGVLLIAHGLGEHGGCYDRFAEVLVNRPGLVDVVAFDFRGHGLSGGRRGVVLDYEELVDDLRAMIEWTQEQNPNRPLFLFGHSNGGQVALRTVLEEPEAVAGLILSNPSLRLALEVSRHKILIGRFLRRFAPRLTLAGQLASEHLSRDPAFDARRRADSLRHNRISPALFFEMVEGGPQVMSRAHEIQLPVFMILGGSDPVVDHQAAQELFEDLASSDKTLLLDPEAVHEPLSDLGRDQVISELAAWLEARLPSRSERPTP